MDSDVQAEQQRVLGPAGVTDILQVTLGPWFSILNKYLLNTHHPYPEGVWTPEEVPSPGSSAPAIVWSPARGVLRAAGHQRSGEDNNIQVWHRFKANLS